MKLVYTGIRNQLTPLLAKEAVEQATAGKRVFYIAPSSLSFEKERAVLSQLENGATFDIMVTRFAQMARYFTLHQERHQQSLDELGLMMLFYRVLSQLDDSMLKVYAPLARDLSFVQQLVDLYQEMQAGQVQLEDLAVLEDEAKKADLEMIFGAVSHLVQTEGWEQETKIGAFIDRILSGKLDAELAQVVVIVDGFSRFSAEEEALIAALHGRVSEIVIGVYASEKAYRATYIEGSLYQAGVEFLRDLARQFQIKPIYIGEKEKRDTFGSITQALESLYDYGSQPVPLLADHKEKIAVWEVPNQQQELEAVAGEIRYLLDQGYRYKDMLVLLGDVEAYRLQLHQVFEQYEIPYYLGRAEEMSEHPLVQVVESLERLLRYRFRQEDVLQLLKSGLYGRSSQEELDIFEQYVLFADLQGRAAFSRDFTVNRRDKYNLHALNVTRQSLIGPLLELFIGGQERGAVLLERLLDFFQTVQLSENMQDLCQGSNQWQMEKEEQVWKTFTHILETFHHLFGEQILEMADLLALVRAGFKSSTYRTVPATVDVVNVKDYGLAEPHAAKFVYALGLTQTVLPRQVSNTSLLTEQERQWINESSQKRSRFELLEQGNVQKNHAAVLSIVNAASHKLILSAPRLLNESEELPSSYLFSLKKLGVSWLQKEKTAMLTPQTIGGIKSLLSRLVEVNRSELADVWGEEEATKWAVLSRYVRKQLEEQGVRIPCIADRLTTKPLETDTLAKLYPEREPLVLSASSVSDFYQNEYLYFVKHVLRLQEQDSIHPDARSHGTFLHRILEKALETGSLVTPEELENAISKVKQEPLFQALYWENLESQFSQSVLETIIRATAPILQGNQGISVLRQEASFGGEQSDTIQLSTGHNLLIRGKIDRLDRMEASGALGVVDYKSSDQSFHIDRFYNGLSPQLITYLQAIQSPSVSVFGAMYLQLLEPLIKLADVKHVGEVVGKAEKTLVYKGIFVEEESDQLTPFYQTTKNSLFTRQELLLLLEYQQKLYRQAAERIVTGTFAINPYTEDGKSVLGEQLKAITGFETNRHLGQARQLVTGGSREDWLERMKGEHHGD